MTTRKLQRPFELKAIKADGTFTGYGSVFGELDSYRDIVMPGAFAKSLAGRSADRPVPMLLQHNAQEPIGIYTTVREDDIGLYLEGEINMEVTKGRETHALMKQRAITGLSIGYNTVRDDRDEKAMTRKLFELDLWEISPVTFPAGDTARVHSVKSIEGLASLSDCEDILRDAGFSRKEAAAFVSRIKAVGTQSDSVDADAIRRVKNILNSITVPK